MVTILGRSITVATGDIGAADSCVSISTVAWWKRAINAALTAAVVVGPTLLYSPVAAAADAAPTVKVIGSVSCSPTTVGNFTVYFTVSQGPGPGGRFTSVNASPISTVYGPQNELSSGTPAIFRVGITVPDAAWSKFSESFAATVAFDLPDGTVDVNASTTITLPLCPALISPDADTYVQHCDRSVDAYVVYDPAYPAAPTTFTFSGRGYTGIAPYDVLTKVVTVSPGQTAHAFFPANHAYSIQLAQEKQAAQYGDSPTFSGVPQGCQYFPPPGSPESLSSTPPPGAPQTPAATQSGQIVGSGSSSQPVDSATGDSGPAGVQVTPTGAWGASDAPIGASVNPTLTTPSHKTRTWALAAHTRSAVIWPAAIGAVLGVALAGIIIVRRRRVRPAASGSEQPVDPVS